jgi:integrase
MPLSEVTAFAIERWRASRCKVVSRTTVNRELNIVLGCFSREVEWGRLEAAPMRAVRAYRVDNVRTRILTEQEIERVGGADPEFLGLIGRTTLESLPRLAEVVRPHRDDVGPTDVRILQSKTGKLRRVPLTPDLRARLAEYVEHYYLPPGLARFLFGAPCTVDHRSPHWSHRLTTGFALPRVPYRLHGQKTGASADPGRR